MIVLLIYDLGVRRSLAVVDVKEEEFFPREECAS